ncbi:hypothetical protein IFT76_20640, partial [Pseudomonas sp. CFBP 13727]|nr:hypothetical protein [Pseudomonas sp. CFBP 13727]
YELIPSAGATGVSESVLISVQDAASQTWPAPQIHDHTGGPVTSWSPVKPGTTQANTASFVLRDMRLRVGDSVMPFWRVAGNADQAIPPITVSVAGEARGAIPAPILAASLGKTAEVFYAANQSGVVRPVSEVLSLQVLALPATALSELVILEAANSGAGPELDVSGAATATLRVGVWPLIAEGQPVWLSLSGTKSDGSPYSKVIWAAGSSKVNATWLMDGHWSTTLPIAELKQLQDSSALTITFKAGLGGTQEELNAVAFVPKVYNVKAVADTTPVISSVRDSMGEVSDNGTTHDANVEIRGTATAMQQIEIFDNTSVSKGVAEVDGGGGWSHYVTELAHGAHALTAKALYGSERVSSAHSFSRTLPTTEDFENAQIGPVGAEGLSLPTMTIYNCIIYEGSQAPWGGLYGNYITSTGSPDARADLKAGALKIKYNSANNVTNDSIRYYDASQQLIKTSQLGGAKEITVTFTRDRPCHRIVFQALNGTLHLDNFVFEWA